MMMRRGNTELKFNPLYTTLPVFPKEAWGEAGCAGRVVGAASKLSFWIIKITGLQIF